MGGFRSTTTTDEIKRELKEKYNVTMMTATQLCFRNYGWTFVTLCTSKEAESLVKQSPITLCNAKIDVRFFIDRQKVANHVHNKPNDENILQAIIAELECYMSPLTRLVGNIKNGNNLLLAQQQGLSIGELQTRLFRKFRYRVDGPDLTKIVSNNPTELQIRRQGQETVLRTPIYQVPHDGDFHELRSKMLKIFTLDSRHHHRRSVFFCFETVLVCVCVSLWFCFWYIFVSVLIL